jgi:hypothetical protein
MLNKKYPGLLISFDQLRRITWIVFFALLIESSTMNNNENIFDTSSSYNTVFLLALSMQFVELCLFNDNEDENSENDPEHQLFVIIFIRDVHERTCEYYRRTSY